MKIKTVFKPSLNNQNNTFSVCDNKGYQQLTDIELSQY